MWALLGAQGQTRAGILGDAGTAFDAQKQFLALVEDAIASPVDLGAAIKRYQDVLRYAGSSVNYSFGQGLYMAPSDMELKVGQIAGYNNEIIIAGPGEALGQNAGLNQATDTGATNAAAANTGATARDAAKKTRGSGADTSGRASPEGGRRARPRRP